MRRGAKVFEVSATAGDSHGRPSRRRAYEKSQKVQFFSVEPPATRRRAFAPVWGKF